MPDTPTTLYLDPGRVTDAVTTLLLESILGDFADFHTDRHGRHCATLRKSPGVLSSGERRLWQLACSLSGNAAIDLYDLADGLDDRNATAAAHAITTLLGGRAAYHTAHP
jgi:hypothetical protein